MGRQIRQQLLEVLGGIDRPGTFCASGRLPPALPGLEVVGAGSIALPLEKRQATVLKKLARQAPYGKGTKTLVDTDVRRVWEIDAEQVTLANPEWPNLLQQAVGAVQSELGLEQQNLEAHLYKLLLYEPGSFFLPHRDGEKLDGMVATLVVALPSAHEGGELVIRHEEREVIIDFGAESRFQTQFAAFYADCEHEIRPVRSGFRLALVYNLALQKSKRRITAPTSHKQIAAATRLLRQWDGKGRRRSRSGAGATPWKLAVLLDHQYTPAGLTCDALKGIDRTKADVLFAAAREVGCDASLALVTYWASGSAEPSGDYGYGYGRRRPRGRYDDDYDEDGGGEYVMGEVYDTSLTAEHFRDFEGNLLAFGQIPLAHDELVSKQPLNEGQPDKEEFEGFTGNAGMTLERWYHRAAVVLWPAASRFDVLCEAGMEAAVGGLEQMVRQRKQADQGECDDIKSQCLRFAGRIITHWPERKLAHGHYVDYRQSDADGGDYDDEDVDDDSDSEDDEVYDDIDADLVGSSDVGPGQIGRAPTEASPQHLLSLLQELGDVALISAWIRGVLAKDVSVDPGKTLGDVCEQHGWQTFQNALHQVFEDTSNETLERQARLLADFALRKSKNVDRSEVCAQLAQPMMSAVERWNAQQAERDWRARTVNRGELLPPLTQAFLLLEQPKLLERLVTQILDRPKEFNLTTVQVPALIRLQTWLKRNVKHTASALQRWIAAVTEELNSRESRPPRQPTDWRRESKTGCDCDDCTELSRFLKDPNTKSLRLPLAKDRRAHLHRIIDGKRLDTTHVTERRGRPYTLVCTKTTASYERALKAHEVDCDHLAKIRGLLDWHEGLSSRPEPRRRRTSKTAGKK